jgi:hypothetical protein
MTTLKNEISKLIKENLTHTMCGKKTIQYFSFTSSDFDECENLIEFTGNDENKNVDEYITGLGFEIINNKVDYNHLYILTQTRPFNKKYFSRDEVFDFEYKIEDINPDYIPFIIEKIKEKLY